MYPSMFSKGHRWVEDKGDEDLFLWFILVLFLLSMFSVGLKGRVLINEG